MNAIRAEAKSGSAPLPSWADGERKHALLDLVSRISDEAGPDFVPPSERIATVDNDGTLWCEKPAYVQVDFLIRRFKALATRDPQLAATPPYKAALEDDFGYFAAFQDHLPELVGAIAAAYAGITPEEFAAEVTRFLAETRHPHLGRPYTQVTYAPMRELLALLRARGFKVFIATGGGRDFLRVVSEELYDVPWEYVIGSSVQLEFRDGRLVRLPKLTLPIDDGPGKPVHIFERIGRQPVLAIGNSDGDFEMLDIARYGVLIHHDDADREYAYDSGAERALAAADRRAWIVVSMRNDWRTVFDRSGTREPSPGGDGSSRVGAS